MKKFLATHFDLSNDENIVCLTAISVFLPYYIGAVLLLAIVGYVLIKKNVKKDIFCHTGSFLIPVFCGLTFVVGTCHNNYFGMAVSAIVLLIFILGFYIRTVMTGEIFEKMLSYICAASVVTSVLMIFERLFYLVFFGDPSHRCFGDFFGNKYLSFYFNPNYLSSVLAAVVIICAYKVILRKGDMRCYYATAILAMIAIYFGGSMFAWAEVCFALAVYLFVGKHRRLLGVMFAICAAIGLSVYMIPDIFPRLADASMSWDARMLIWELALSAIPQAFMFGKGFYSYRLLSYTPENLANPTCYPAFHAHNLVIEFLISFGFIGTLIFLAFVFILFQKVFMHKQLLKKSQISTLIIAIMAGILMHSILDMTMLFIQPMMLYCLIFGGIGADEKVVYEIFEKRKQA